MPMRAACLLLSVLAACTSADRSLEGQGNALADRIDSLARPARGGMIVDSVRRDLVSLRDHVKKLAGTESARLPKARSGAEDGTSTIGRHLEKLGSSLPKLATFLNLPSGAFLQDSHGDDDGTPRPLPPR